MSTKTRAVTVLEPQLVTAIAANDYLGETPVWSAQSLFWINCEQPPQLRCWDSQTGERRTWRMPKRIGGFVLTQDENVVVVVLEDGIYRFDLRSQAFDLIASSPLEHAALHECVCDRSGRLWVGAIDHRIGKPSMQPRGGALFRLEGTKLVRVVDGITCSNGLAVSPDGRTLYHTDSPTGIVEAFTLDPESGQLTERRELFRLAAGEGFCDGATVDSAGGYWATLVYGSALRRYTADGALDVEVRLPFGNPTSVAFGGSDLGDLYVTTTQMTLGAPLPGHEQLGHIYRFRPGVTGLAPTKFTS